MFAGVSTETAASWLEPKGALLLFFVASWWIL